MAEWTRQGMRLDVALAVALEIGKLRLETAETSAERRSAMDYNHDLWRCVRRLALTAADLSDRNCLMSGADAVAAAWNDPGAISARNVDLARILAGRAATNGALKLLLDDWVVHRRSAPRAEFGAWLLGRLAGEATDLPVAA